MVPSKTSAEILEVSKRVAQTDGEWELSNVEVVPATLEIADGKYSQIIYHVRSFSFLNLQTNITVKKCVIQCDERTTCFPGPHKFKGVFF